MASAWPAAPSPAREREPVPAPRRRCGRRWRRRRSRRCRGRRRSCRRRRPGRPRGRACCSTSERSSVAFSARAARTSAWSWRARAPARCLGLEAGEAGGGLVGERAGEQHLVVGELPARAEDRDRDVADLAAPARSGRTATDVDVEALDEVRPQLGGAGRRRRRGTGRRWSSRGRCPTAGRVEHLHVAGILDAVDAHDVGVADARRPGRPRTAAPGRRRAPRRACSVSSA